jgi:pre-mRNA-processing factor SLU7
MAQMELQSLKAQERGEDSLTLQANPTLAELNFKKQQEEKNNQKDVNRISILEKYGGIEHLENPHKDLLTAQSEHYVEYSRTGKVIKGQERIIAKSKYEEDVYPSNHTSIFGSYWHEGQWGYKCCHSFMKNSYCIPIENSE